MEKLPKPGDRVIVPAGGREVEGEVMYVSPQFDPPEVSVAYRFGDEDEEPQRNIYRVDRIQPAPAR